MAWILVARVFCLIAVVLQFAFEGYASWPAWVAAALILIGLDLLIKRFQPIWQQDKLREKELEEAAL